VPAGPVEGAFRVVARHRFLPGLDLDRVYDAEAAIPTKREPDGEITSSSSAPAIMGLMLGDLAVEPSHRVLEIGAGTGYNAALLATLAGPTGAVTSIDLAPDVAAGAAANLVANGFAGVVVRAGDGWLGAADRAPFDRIIVTVGVPDLSPAWVAQLAPGGRLVVPLSLAAGVEAAVAFVRDGVRLRSLHLNPCGFMRLRGSHADPGWSGQDDGRAAFGRLGARRASGARGGRAAVATEAGAARAGTDEVTVSIGQLEVEAVPTAEFGSGPVGESDWVVARPSFTFLVRRR